MHRALFYGLLTFRPRKKLCPLPFSVRGEVLLKCKKTSLKWYYWRSHCWIGLSEKKIEAVCLEFKKLDNTWMIDTYPFPHIKEILAELHSSSQYLRNVPHQITSLKRSRDLCTCISYSGFSVQNTGAVNLVGIPLSRWEWSRWRPLTCLGFRALWLLLLGEGLLGSKQTKKRLYLSSGISHS